MNYDKDEMIVAVRKVMAKDAVYPLPANAARDVVDFLAPKVRDDVLREVRKFVKGLADEAGKSHDRSDLKAKASLMQVYIVIGAAL